jgi:cardiolipin synthase
MNIANILTTIRFILIPAFVFVFFSKIENSFVISIYIFLISGATDVLDGYIARKFNMITRLGAVIDPLADKLMTMTVLFCLSYGNIIPMWVFIIILLKELTMIAGGAALWKLHMVIPARSYGKAATFLLYASIGFMAVNRQIGIYIIYAAIIMAFVAFGYYFKKYISIRKAE